VRRRPHPRQHHEARGNLKNIRGDPALPGMTINTSPTDYRINKQLQMMKFNGERWELFGPILEDDAAM
jgi:branched-chain amino acid transport system substrate-binding protein